MLKATMKRSSQKCQDYPGILLKQIECEGLPLPVREHRFHPVRRWRFDRAYPGSKIAIEYECGIFSGGAYTRGKHFQSDCEKYNTSTPMGWHVFRVYCDMIYKGKREVLEALELVRSALSEFWVITSNQ